MNFRVISKKRFVDAKYGRDQEEEILSLETVPVKGQYIAVKLDEEHYELKVEKVVLTPRIKDMTATVFLEMHDNKKAMAKRVQS